MWSVGILQSLRRRWAILFGDQTTKSASAILAEFRPNNDLIMPIPGYSSRDVMWILDTVTDIVTSFGIFATQKCASADGTEVPSLSALMGK